MRARTNTLTVLPFLLIFSLIGYALAEDSESRRILEEVESFAEVGKTLEEKRIPLLLMFSSDHCHYCYQVEDDFLIPMQISGDYGDRALLRKLSIDYGKKVKDFDGKTVAASDFAERYGITVTPTVIFVDSNGRQVAPKRVGLMTPDFYGGYLDESIAIGLDILRRDKPLRVTLTEQED